MFIRLEDFPLAVFAGCRMEMSYADNKTFELWRSFMPRRKELINLDDNFYSIEEYPDRFFEQFNPNKLFSKWAAVKVKHSEQIPAGFEAILVPGGLYAVFLHKGPAYETRKTYSYIFESWIPASKYAIDLRPHFAVMDERYKADDPESKEEIFIPIKKKLPGS